MKPKGISTASASLPSRIEATAFLPKATLTLGTHQSSELLAALSSKLTILEEQNCLGHTHDIRLIVKFIEFHVDSTTSYIRCTSESFRDPYGKL